MEVKLSGQEMEHDKLQEEELFEEVENEERISKIDRIDWGYDKGERIFKLKNLKFKPFTTAVTELEKYGEAIILTGNLYARHFVESLPDGSWRMKYYEKPFPEYCVQGHFLEGVTSVEMTDIDVNYDLIYHIVENENVLSHIKLLMLRNCNVLDEQLKVLFPRLGNAYVLKDLDLSHNPIGDQGLITIVKYLQHCASLRTLNLFDTQITSFGLEKLANIYSKQQILLKKLNIGKNSFNNQNSVKKLLAGIVKRSAPLEELLMANCQLQGAEMASNLETTLLLSDTLKYLDISFNYFSTEEELSPIIVLFARSLSIKEMVLNFNPITDNVLTYMLDCLFEYSRLEPTKHLYLENMTMPQVYFKTKWHSFNRNDLKITTGGVRKIQIPKIDSFKYKLVKRFNFLYKKKKHKKDTVVTTLQDNLPGKGSKRVKVDDFKDALMLVGKIDFVLIQDIVTEFSGGGTRANVKEFIDIYNELFPVKPKIPKKPAAGKKSATGKKKNSKKSVILTEKKPSENVETEDAPTTSFTKLSTEQQ